jgi:hypothetical protein
VGSRVLGGSHHHLRDLCGRVGSGIISITSTYGPWSVLADTCGASDDPAPRPLVPLMQARSTRSTPGGPAGLVRRGKILQRGETNDITKLDTVIVATITKRHAEESKGKQPNDLEPVNHGTKPPRALSCSNMQIRQRACSVHLSLSSSTAKTRSNLNDHK